MKNFLSNLIVTVVMCTGCSDFLSENPYGTVTPETFYKTEADAVMAATACYRQLNNPSDFWADGFDGIGDVQSDDVAQFLEWTGVMNTFQFDENHELIKGVWTAAYKGISICNSCIDNVSSMSISEDVKNQVIGQARFIRAYWYFRLVRLYGGVPLVTKEYKTLED